MNRLFLILSVFVASCSSKSIEYWIQPENQNGNLDGFYATYEYCVAAQENCSEFEILLAINDSIIVLQSDSSQFSDSTLLLASSIIDKINDLYETMLDHCGGRCITNGTIPVLPYRTVDVRKFWGQTRYVLKFEYILDKFESLVKQDISENSTNTVFYLFDKQNITTQNVIDKMLLNENTLNALINLKRIELAILKKAASIQLDSADL